MIRIMCVSILVLVDAALRPSLAVLRRVYYRYVSILVLVDAALRLVCECGKVFPEKRFQSLF